MSIKWFSPPLCQKGPRFRARVHWPLPPTRDVVSWVHGGVCRYVCMRGLPWPKEVRCVTPTPFSRVGGGSQTPSYPSFPRKKPSLRWSVGGGVPVPSLPWSREGGRPPPVVPLPRRPWPPTGPSPARPTPASPPTAGCVKEGPPSAQPPSLVDDSCRSSVGRYRFPLFKPKLSSKSFSRFFVKKNIASRS